MNSSHEEQKKLVKFLLVEDDDDHAVIISRVLSQARILNHVDRLKDGVSVIEYLTQRGAYSHVELPDVILLDLKLPKKDGLEVLAEVKSYPQLRSIPIVILTTSNAEVDKLKAYENFANSYLLKPIEPEKFRQLVEDLNLYWGILNQIPNKKNINDQHEEES